MFPWMLDLAAPLPLPRAPGQLRASPSCQQRGQARVGGGGSPPAPAALPNDNAAPGVMTPRAALLLDVVAPRLMSLLHKQQHEERPR